MSIRYAQCWEDPSVLLPALNVKPGDNVVSIASGGDNSLALLLADPRRVTAVDYSAAQIYLTELKARAMLPLTYEQFVSFLGARESKRRMALYDKVRPHLTDEACRYWDNHSKAVERGVIHCGKFERYFSTFRNLVLPLVHSRSAVHRLLAIRSPVGRERYYQSQWNNRRWRLLFGLFFSRYIMSRLGREAAYFQQVGQGDIADCLFRRTEHGLTTVPVAGNYFLEYIFTGRYRTLEYTHPYLRRANFETIRSRLNRLNLVTGSLDDYLAEQKPGTVSKLNLSDILEYLDETAVIELLQKILRACKPGALIAFWTLFVPRSIPAELRDRLGPANDAEPGRRDRDRGFFYGDFHLWQTK